MTDVALDADSAVDSLYDARAMGNGVVPFRIDPKPISKIFASGCARTRWPEAETVEGWAQGTPLAYARELCRYWLDKYDWAKAQDRLNRFSQFRTKIDGLDIRFVPTFVPLTKAPSRWS